MTLTIAAPVVEVFEYIWYSYLVMQRYKRSHECPTLANNPPTCGPARICPEITGKFMR